MIEITYQSSSVNIDTDLLYLVRDQVKVDVELGSDPVLHRDLDRVLLLVGHGGQLQGGVDDAGDAEVQQTFGGHGSACCQVQLVRQFTAIRRVINSFLAMCVQIYMQVIHSLKNVKIRP